MNNNENLKKKKERKVKISKKKERKKKIVNAINEGFVYGFADCTDLRSDANNAISNSVKSVAGAL